jgi:glyceraldehyde 3-phosphate dehydrogenase
MVRIAINGFGRIGRQIYRILLEHNFLDQQVQVVAINDTVSAQNLAYLLKYDSVHGTLPYEVTTDGDRIIVWQHSFLASALRVKPQDLSWADQDIDIVLECTGVFNTKADLEGHFSYGAKSVIVSAPADDVQTIVIGVNTDQYHGQTLISNASCTTNCLAPLAKILLDAGIGIQEALMTTCHAYTGSQQLVDSSSKKAFRDGRAAWINIIPASTGAAKMLGILIPELAGKITGMALRVPVANVSVVDLTFRSTRPTSLWEINTVIQHASQTSMKGIVWYTQDPVVSSDFIHDSRSCIYDATASIQLNDHFFKLIARYDNEWAYSNRMVDLIRMIIGHRSLT